MSNRSTGTMALPNHSLRRNPIARVLPLFSAALMLVVVLQSAAGEEVPIPQPKPEPTGTPAKPPSTPPPAPSTAPTPAEPPPPPSPAELFQQCLAQMRGAGMEFATLDKVTEGRCTIEGAVALQSVTTPSGKVELPDHPRIRCAFGVKFGRWIAEAAAPIIAAHAGASLKAIVTGPGFVCRNRNRESSGKVSEHARGNAIDVASFELADRRRLTVGDPEMAGSLAVALKGLRTSACGYFTTVLGPGSNEAHKDHLHFDSGLHGRTDNYRICE
jgi:hypothetical protein